MKKILLHACCATCAGYCIEKLKSMDYEPVLYFYNPNIFPPDEFMKRYRELEKYCEKMGLELLIDKQDASVWYDYIAGLEDEPEKGKRCTRCFELRLFQTAAKAIKLNIDTFTTTLTVSPHKNSKQIFGVGKGIAEKFDLNFLEEDFKKQNGFLKTMEISKKEGFYRQNYCGCEYSIFKEN
ncbi:MAG: epoxyqueuosine reductase QueH [Candidatus Gastranaerophilales bacterium]|nr:epoxyqueuosine reductase QueH [Candidatus Gastranaerophilales bacterium]